MTKFLLTAALAGALCAPTPAFADYPVSGHWTYRDVSGAGPSRDCSGARMTFAGMIRKDDRGFVREYRNVSVTQSDRDQWRVVDEFPSARIRGGRLYYTLIRRDADHIELKLNTGPLLRLRRCE